ncbi:MAG: OmpA family protein [Cytophagaceae bacterium]
MINYFRFTLFVIIFSNGLLAYSQDKLSDANQKKIDELKARIDKLNSINNHPDSLIHYLKEVIRQQQDSIQQLTIIVKEKTQLNPCNCSWVYYELGKSRTDYSKYPELDSIASQLKSNRALQLKLIGHADKTGSETLNQRLSLQRAKNLKEYLVNRYKVRTEQIKIEGRGSKEPVKGNADPNFFQIDRRVEIYIVMP